MVRPWHPVATAVKVSRAKSLCEGLSCKTKEVLRLKGEKSLEQGSISDLQKVMAGPLLLLRCTRGVLAGSMLRQI